MKITEIKEKIDFYSDALFQRGYDVGWSAFADELDARSDAEWNIGNRTTAEIIRKLVKEMRDPQ